MTHEERVIALLTSINDHLRTMQIYSEAQASKLPLAPANRCEDRIVRFDPYDWDGPSYKGKDLSQCPPRFLDAYASQLKYFADKEQAAGEVISKGKAKGKLKHPYTLAECGYARRWALNKRIAGEPEVYPVAVKEMPKFDEDAPPEPEPEPEPEPAPHDPDSFEFGHNGPTDNAGGAFDDAPLE